MIDYTGAPRKPLLDLLKAYDSKKMYLVLEDVLGSPDAYEIVYQDILDIMKWGFEFLEIRTRQIKFKILASDKKYYQMEMRHFLSNLILWYAFMETDTIEALKIFDYREANTNAILDYMEENILPVCQSDFFLQNKIVDEIIYHMNCISSTFGVLFGAGISIYNIIQTEKANPRISEILYGDLDPSLQPNEIEEELNKRTKEMIKLFSEVDNDLKPLFKSGKNLSEGQFKELVVKIGLKADINGNTIPHLLNTNILVGGIATPADHYIEAVSGRKSLVLQKTKMGLPGSFSKKITTNTAPIRLRQDHDMCNTETYLTYHIEDASFLKLLNNRYYVDDDGKLKVLNFKKDTHLIGKTLQFKSPCTCSSTEGVCKYCYGDLYSTNAELYSAGAYAATKMANPLGQMVLSAKHLQLTHTTPVTFNDDFNRIFELNLNEISVKDQDLTDNMDLYVQLGTIYTEEMEDDELFFVKEFKVIDLINRYEFPISEDNGSNLYLTKELLTLHRKYNKEKTTGGLIPLDEFDDDSSVLFYVEVKNKELTKPFKDLETLLNSNDKFGCKTLDEIAQKMGRIVIDAGINIDLVHNEMIIRGLTRKASNEYEDIDFSPTGDTADYKVLRLNDAMFKSPSPTISLSYGYLRKQLLSVEFYQKRGVSHLDPLFVPQLSGIIPEGK